MGYSIYVFLDNKNKPYYVGKTNDIKRRKKEHLLEIEKGNKLPKYNKARKLISLGYPLKMKKIDSTFSEEKAWALERKYIRKYRKEGYVLMNCTYGGPDELPMKINKKVIKKVELKGKRKKEIKKNGQHKILRRGLG